MRAVDGRVEFELKSNDAALLHDETVCRVDGQDIPLITDVKLVANAGGGATVELRANLCAGLDVKLPASVALTLTVYDFETELVEEPLEGGGRRLFVRPRDPQRLKNERAYHAITGGLSSARLNTIGNVIGNIRLAVISLEKGFDTSRVRELEALVRKYARELVDVADYIEDVRIGS